MCNHSTSERFRSRNEPRRESTAASGVGETERVEWSGVRPSWLAAYCRPTEKLLPSVLVIFCWLPDFSVNNASNRTAITDKRDYCVRSAVWYVCTMMQERIYQLATVVRCLACFFLLLSSLLLCLLRGWLATVQLGTVFIRFFRRRRRRVSIDRASLCWTSRFEVQGVRIYISI